MATLFERIAGIQADGQVPAEGKIPIHIFLSVLREFKDGRVTAQQAKVLLGLTNENASDVQWLIQAVQASSNKGDFLRTIKDHFYLAEWKGTRDTFAVEADFYQKLQQIITDEGGTPPAR